MSQHDLFAAEAEVLSQAQAALDRHDLSATEYRHALSDLARQYQRLMRETHRLIRHGDRTEAELNQANARLQQLSAELDYKARHDPLTGTLNRGAIFERATQYLQQQPLSLIVLDIDLFKRINDQYGHPTGDAVLCELVTRITHVLSERGDMGRVGGEEFTILLPDASLSHAAEVAEAMRAHIHGHAFECLPRHPVSASFGVSHSLPGSAFKNAYAQADAALYQAKHQGRNRVVKAAPAPASQA